MVCLWKHILTLGIMRLPLLVLNSQFSHIICQNSITCQKICCLLQNVMLVIVQSIFLLFIFPLHCGGVHIPFLLFAIKGVGTKCAVAQSTLGNNRKSNWMVKLIGCPVVIIAIIVVFIFFFPSQKVKSLGLFLSRSQMMLLSLWILMRRKWWCTVKHGGIRHPHTGVTLCVCLLIALLLLQLISLSFITNIFKSSVLLLFSWYINGTEVDAEADYHYSFIDGNLIITNASEVTDYGKYQCKAENSFGTVLSQDGILQFACEYTLIFSLNHLYKNRYKNSQICCMQ